jgi:hypothetical protein
MKVSMHMLVLLKRHCHQTVKNSCGKIGLVQNTCRATGSCETLLYDSRSPEDIHFLCLELFKRVVGVECTCAGPLRPPPATEVVKELSTTTEGVAAFVEYKCSKLEKLPDKAFNVNHERYVDPGCSHGNGRRTCVN